MALCCDSKLTSASIDDRSFAMCTGYYYFLSKKTLQICSTYNDVIEGEFLSHFFNLLCRFLVVSCEASCNLLPPGQDVRVWLESTSCTVSVCSGIPTIGHCRVLNIISLPLD